MSLEIGLLNITEVRIMKKFKVTLYTTNIIEGAQERWYNEAQAVSKEALAEIISEKNWYFINEGDSLRAINLSHVSDIGISELK